MTFLSGFLVGGLVVSVFDLVTLLVLREKFKRVL